MPKDVFGRLSTSSNRGAATGCVDTRREPSGLISSWNQRLESSALCRTSTDGSSGRMYLRAASTDRLRSFVCSRRPVRLGVAGKTLVLVLRLNVLVCLDDRRDWEAFGFRITRRGSDGGAVMAAAEIPTGCCESSDCAQICEGAQF